MKYVNKILALETLGGLYFLVRATTEASKYSWELFSFFLASIITTYGLYKIRETTATS